MSFKGGKWIWTKDNKKENDWAIFKREFYAYDLPKNAVLRVSCDTKYYLWINGELVVFDGNLYRESADGCGYYDKIDIAKHIKIGLNVLLIRVWHYGNGGRNNTPSGSAGLIFECEELGLFSDKNTLAARMLAHYTSSGENPSYLYGGHNIAYDARNDTISFNNAEEYGDYPCLPWNTLEERPIPLFWFDEIKSMKYEKEGDKFIVKLPYAMQFTPLFKVRAEGGEVIDIRSDRYAVNGGPGDNRNQYFGHRTEYICKKGEQEFESLNWIFGEKIIFSIPQGVEVIALGCRESRYATQPRAIIAEDERLNKLLKKCARTLVVCMRDNFMDCPDRERGQWIGDVSVQAPQVFYALDDSAVLLLKKAIKDFIRLRKGDVLVGNVPGIHYSELPAQSLNAISEVGMIAEYYKNTEDIEILKLAYEPCVNYLKLFETNEDGLIKERAGDWAWYDHLYNQDNAVLINTWFYSAVKFAIYMGSEIGDNAHAAFLNNRKKSVEDNFNRIFWKGGYYASAAAVDDRANAMAVLSGLAGENKYIDIADVLSSVFNSTTYMETYVLEALCRMGRKDLAYRRMMSRYYNLIENDNSTLWEDFYILGTKNHAWSGSPLSIVCRHFPELIK